MQRFLKYKAIFIKEIIHISRDIRTLILSLIVPIFFIVIFGYAIKLEVKNISVSIVDHEQNNLSREIKNKLNCTGVFKKIYEEYELGEEKFLENKIKAKIYLKQDLSEELTKKGNSEIILIIDGTDPTMFSTLSGYFIRIFSERENTFDFKYKVLFNEEMKSEIYIVPGIIAIVLAVLSSVLITISITKEYEMQTFQMLLTLPLKPYEIILGKVFPYILLGILQFSLSLLSAKILFNIPFRGNLFFLYLSAFIYILSGLGIGIIISTSFKKTQTSLLTTWLTTILPSFLLSGFIFPLENIPQVLKILSYFVPARYFMEILRGILLRGTNIFFLLDELFILTIISSFLIFMASKMIKEKI
ncbi:MAG: ABC transporter permease [Candidatus Hydrothermales bacterium]